MEWEFADDTPIYLQIMSIMKMQIAAGNLQPGEKIAPVRELAMEAGVNPNTMQKALSELEREGVLYSQRTAGRFVAENKTKIGGMQEQMAREQIIRFAQAMERLGYQPREALQMFEQYVSGQDDGQDDGLDNGQ